MVTRTSNRPTTGEADSLVLDVLWRARWLIAVGFILGGLLGYFVGQQQPVRYAAQARLVLGSSTNFSPLGDTNYDPDRFVANQISIIRSSPVLEQAIQLIQPTTNEANLRVAMDELAESVEASASGNSDVIAIETTAPTAALAKSRADAVAAAYMNFTKQRVDAQTQQAMDTTDDANRRTTMQTQAAIYGDGVAVFEPASLPLEPSAPRPLRNALILAVFGAVLAMGWALVRQAGGGSGTTWHHAAADLRLPVLGEVPAVTAAGSSAVTTSTDTNGSRDSDAFQTVLVGLDYIDGSPIGAVMVTGSVPRSVTRGVSRELAIAAAGQGRRVVLVTADPRGREQSAPGEAAGGVGPQGAGTSMLTGVKLELVQGRILSRPLSGPASENIADPGRHSPLPPCNRAELERLRGEADLIILDAPSLMTSPIAYGLAGVVDAVLLVVDQATTAEDVAVAEERVVHAGSRLAGVISTLATPRRRGRRQPDRGQPEADSRSVHMGLPVHVKDDIRA